MTAKPRHKKASRRKPKAIRFKLVVEGQTMIVGYKPNYMGDCGHFEFQSPHKSARRIPVSTTGYLSHFASMDEVKAAKSPQAYAREVVLAALAPRRPVRSDEAKQLPLFA